MNKVIHRPYISVFLYLSVRVENDMLYLLKRRGQRNSYQTIIERIVGIEYF